MNSKIKLTAGTRRNHEYWHAREKLLREPLLHFFASQFQTFKDSQKRNQAL
jgi:hypothetical protein